MRIIPTTLVIARLIGAHDPLDRRIIWLGVSGKSYPFALRDAYTDTPQGDSAWNDIWRWARQFRPNLIVVGRHMNELAALTPGETFTLRGVYARMMRTFEVTEVSPGEPFQPPRKF